MKNSKAKLVVSFILIMLIASSILPEVYASSDIKVMVDGNYIAFDQPPIIDKGRTLVPFRAIFEALGAEVQWDDRTKTATGVKGNNVVKLQVGNRFAMINGREVLLDVEPITLNGRTLVPARFSGESLDASVEWDSQTRIVIIKSKDESLITPIVNTTPFDKGIYGFGAYSTGQLGLGEAAELQKIRGQVRGFNTPQVVPVFENISKISTTYTTTLVLTEKGEVYSFGLDYFLGYADNFEIGRLTQPSPTPRKIPNLPRIKEVSAGLSHGFVIDEKGNLYGFGDNDQQAVGFTKPSPTWSYVLQPRLKEDMPNSKTAQAGQGYSLVVDEKGDLYGFGYNLDYLLGKPMSRYSPLFGQEIPIKVEGITNIKDIRIGSRFVVALLENGDVYSFGADRYVNSDGEFVSEDHVNTRGQLGHGDTIDRTTPTKIKGISNVVAITTGREHTLLLTDNGEVYGFGENHSGQLGLGDKEDRLSPTKIEGIGKVKAIAAGNYHSLLLMENGDVYSFGSNSGGQLGHGDYDRRFLPTKIEGFTNVKMIAAGGDHSFVYVAE